MSHRETALRAYADALLALLRQVITSLPEDARNLPAIKVAQEGLDTISPLMLATASSELHPQSFRHTGRTHRMLIEALAIARTDRAVLILVRDRQREGVVLDRIDAMPNVADIRHRIVVRAYTDLERGNVLAGRRFAAVFEDHEVGEARASDWASKKIALMGESS